MLSTCFSGINFGESNWYLNCNTKQFTCVSNFLIYKCTKYVHVMCQCIVPSSLCAIKFLKPSHTVELIRRFTYTGKQGTIVWKSFSTEIYKSCILPAQLWYLNIMYNTVSTKFFNCWAIIKSIKKISMLSMLITWNSISRPCSPHKRSYKLPVILVLQK